MAGKIYITEEGKKNTTTEKKTYQRADGTVVARPSATRTSRAADDTKTADKKSAKDNKHDEEIEAYARKMLRKKEQRRNIILIACAALAVFGIGFLS